jgi:SAM-dependent methyltransferase
MADFIEVLQCPVSKGPLRWADERSLISADDQRTYRVDGGVARLLPKDPDSASVARDASDGIREFYETVGWQADDDGLFGDTKAFVDNRSVSVDFSGRCMTRLGRFFAEGGEYLLDAGCGAIPHHELISFSRAFEKRICLDLSVSALQAARAKLGDHGVYVQGDITSLPIRSDSMDAITCNHVIYQIPAEKQVEAFLELWRVLKPGGIAVIVYWWPESALVARAKSLVRTLRGRGQPAAAGTEPAGDVPQIFHHAHSYDWFTGQRWPFAYRIDTFRAVSQSFLRHRVTDDWRGRLFLRALYAVQELAPQFCGRHGAMPAIVVRKPKAG